MDTLTIASNTVREALRERLLYNLVVFAVVLTVGSVGISLLTLGDQTRIVADVGTGSAQIFGTLIAVFVGVSLVSRELDRRTSYAVLARPVSRARFVLGKYLGILATLAINLVVMAVATAAVLRFHRGTLDGLVGPILAAHLVMLAQLAICGAFAVLFACYSTPTLATIFTLSIIGAGHVFGEVRGFWLRAPNLGMKGLVRVLDVVLPNLGLLDLKAAVTYGDPVTAASVVTRTAYGIGYAGVVVALACLVFSRKDLR
jgi:ABC-type transport system involved in multi-copper enzyme maturation permease subunit